MQRRFYSSWNLAPALLTTEQAGLLLQMTPEHVKRLCAKKKLPAQKIGNLWRVDKDKLKAWMEGSQQS